MVHHHYSVDPVNRTVRCWLIIPNNRFHDCWEITGKWEGVAKCDPKDEWNEEIGKDIAYKRALIKLKKAEIELHKQHALQLQDLAREYFKTRDKIECCEERIFQLNNIIAEYKD